MDGKSLTTDAITNNVDLQDALEPVAEPVLGRKRSRKRSIIIFVVVSLLNIGLLALLWTQLLTPHAGTQDNSGGLGDMPSPLLNKAAPDFTLPVLNGNGAQVHLADFKGKAVILNFWLSSCGPCQQEAPFLQQTWTQLRSRGIVMLGIDGPEKASDSLGYIQKYGNTYTNVQDTLDAATQQSYGVTGNPETFFINKDGVIVARWASPLTSQGLQLELARLKLK